MSFELQLLYTRRRPFPLAKEFVNKQQRLVLQLFEGMQDQRTEEDRRAFMIARIPEITDIFGSDQDLSRTRAQTKIRPNLALFNFLDMLRQRDIPLENLDAKLIDVIADRSKTPYERVGECMREIVSRLKAVKPKLNYREHRAIRDNMNQLLDAIAVQEIRYDTTDTPTMSASQKIKELECRWKELTDIPFVFCNSLDYAFHPANEKSAPIGFPPAKITELYHARRAFFGALSPKETLLMSPKWGLIPEQGHGTTLNTLRQRLLFSHALYEPLTQENAMYWIEMLQHNSMENPQPLSAKAAAYIESLNSRVGTTFETMLGISLRYWAPFLDTDRHSQTIKPYQGTNLADAYKELIQRFPIAEGNPEIHTWMKNNGVEIPHTSSKPRTILEIFSTVDPVKYGLDIGAYYYSKMLNTNIDALDIPDEPSAADPFDISEDL